ncbi:L-fucose operon activator [Enterobacter hormaechei]|uniref:L-fucose operon activator n=1 Tax=Enterobacter hormaechei TaxID=158836 RepID=UPI003CED3693
MKESRHKQIIQLLMSHDSLSNDELVGVLSVSHETLRRDLRELQAQGLIQRTHGRAKYIRKENPDSGDSFINRLKSHHTHKVDIAREALTWISEGMVVALDASSTCWHLARQLDDCEITIFTNSHPICIELGKREKINLISSGGSLHRKYGCYISPSLFHQVKSLEIDLFIFSCEGVDQSGNIWDSNIYNAEFKKTIIKRANQSILVIDKRKLNRAGEINIGHIDDIFKVIS